MSDGSGVIRDGTESGSVKVTAADDSRAGAAVKYSSARSGPRRKDKSDRRGYAAGLCRNGMKRYDTRPKKDGFRLPAEFEPHAGCWMLWPQRATTWRFGGKPAQKAFVKVAQAISKYEPVTVGVNEDQYANAVEMLPDTVRVVEIANNDAWMRDIGATFVKNDETGEVRGVDWQFNAWGGLVDGAYFPWDLDQQVARKMCDMERLDRYALDDFVLEGGSVHTDGDGTLITTEECLLSDGRNHNLSKEEIGEVLCSYLGADKVIWLKNGIYLDETNGHVDNMCCFVEPGKVLLAWTDNEKDPQYQSCRENLEILEQETDAKGRKLEVVKLPLPSPVTLTEEEAGSFDLGGTHARLEGERLPASYINFYIANGAVIAPRFGDEKDAEAAQILQECFPDRIVSTIDSREILLGGGNIHSITQQQPVAKPRAELEQAEERGEEEAAHE